MNRAICILCYRKIGGQLTRFCIWCVELASVGYDGCCFCCSQRYCQFQVATDPVMLHQSLCLSELYFFPWKLDIAITRIKEKYMNYMSKWMFKDWYLAFPYLLFTNFALCKVCQSLFRIICFCYDIFSLDIVCFVFILFLEVYLFV